MLLGSQLRLRFLARFFLAIILGLGLFNSTWSFAVTADDSLCTLSCCAGRTPHAAGSCMGGSCQAALRKTAKVKRSATRTPRGEQFCNSFNFAKQRLALYRFHGAIRPINPTKSRAAELASSTLKKPCEPDGVSLICSGSGNSSSQKLQLALGDHFGFAPSLKLTASESFNFLQASTNLTEKHSPRGPPLS